MVPPRPDLSIDPTAWHYITEPIWVFDLSSHRVIWANDSALEFWRADSIEDLYQRDMAPVSDLAQARLDGYFQRLERDEVIVADWKFYPDGVETDAHCRCRGVRTKDHRMAMMLQVIDPDGGNTFSNRDTRSLERRQTERDRLAAAEARFRAFTESGTDWLWETDVDHCFIYLSENVREATGHPPRFWLGRSHRDLLAEETNGSEISREHLKALRAHLPFHKLRYRYRRRDGTIGVVSTSGRPMFDASGAFLGYRGIASEISEEQSLKDELHVARQSAELANTAKSEFLSALCRELRASLDRILGLNRSLQSDDEHLPTGTQSSLADPIITECNRLQLVIEQVLELSEIEQGKLVLSMADVEVTPVIEECLMRIEPQAHASGLKVERGEFAKFETMAIRSDAARVKQVLLNLLKNAVAYNTTGTRIGLDCTQVDERFARFEVWDDGPGVPVDKRDAIFQPFNRLATELDRIDGVGIGLTTSQALVDLMGGRIGHETSSAGGASFWLELPLSETPLGAMESAVEKQTASNGDKPGNSVDKRHKVLYVEDNSANMLLMAQILERVGSIDMLEAHTAEIGIALAEAERPSLILMDINLPGMNGIDAMKKIRSIDALSDIPIIAISAAAMPHDVAQAMRAGFVKYLTKPIDIIEVTEAVAEILSELPQSD